MKKYVGKITVDLRERSPLSVEWWPVVGESPKCLTIRRPIQRRWQKDPGTYEEIMRRCKLWSVKVYRNGVAATVYVTAEEGREEAAVRLAMEGLLEELWSSVRILGERLDAVRAATEETPLTL